MGKERISSQEIADYTNINATQIRRDLSSFGKFGKRGVGYSIDGLLERDPQDPAHAGPAQHRARRRRPARPGDRGLADLRRARDHDRRRLRQRPEQGRDARSARRRQPDTRGSRTWCARRTSSSACSPSRPSAAQQAADDLVDAGVKIIFNYSEALLDVPADVTVHTSNPAVELLHALYFHLRSRRRRVRILLWHGYLLGGTGLERLHARARARVEPRRARRDRRLPGARTRSATTSAARASCGPSCRAACCRCSCSTATRGSRRGCCRTSRASERDGATSRRTRRRSASSLPADLVFANHVLLGGAVGAGDAARASASRRTARSSSTRCAAGRSSRTWGREALAGARGRLRRLGAHPRACSRRSSATSTACYEVPPGVDVDEFVPRAARRGARRPARGGARATRRTRATRASGCPTRATPSGSRRSSRTTSRPSSTSAS